jgi:hypothetical protein
MMGEVSEDAGGIEKAVSVDGFIYSQTLAEKIAVLFVYGCESRDVIISNAGF